MSKILKKATGVISGETLNKKFEQYALVENPFPSTPYVNQDSPEKKYNGSIYEESIRLDEFNKISLNFLKVPQANPDHLRLAFISDTSFIGRGNGKSSFLLQLHKTINKDYCLDISDNQNKCFSIYFSPEGSGVVKNFDKFVDNFFLAICKSNIINEALAVLRYEAITNLNKWNEGSDPSELEEAELINNLNNTEWVRSNVSCYKKYFTKVILENSWLTSLPSEFPLYRDLTTVSLSNQETFVEYYKTLRKDKAKLDFVFDHLVGLFLAAGFNGSYVLVDDFEKIPDFQSSNQKKDFSTQLRAVLFDGGYLNARIGFFNFFLALHAGVPRLMQEAWSLAGMEQRVPMIPSSTEQKHIINFSKLENKHAVTLIKKYLLEFRESSYTGDELYPFNEDSIVSLANNSEMNISKMLKNANHILELASEADVKNIDTDFIKGYFSKKSDTSISDEEMVAKSQTVDLISKIKAGK
ncbi:hypothetical protein [Nubsella zeaxanthinifaciens]|uniref:hypothetical protein n=1 Tax=Nubsella zeaxanthinifaciens TaxID=392412 RepID=UPI000DE4C84D|nr:hypothetical protein [Nubsella zeaxanthinifaciens]